MLVKSQLLLVKSQFLLVNSQKNPGAPGAFGSLQAGRGPGDRDVEARSRAVAAVGDGGCAALREEAAALPAAQST